MTVPGFRKGKVPARVIDQRFGRAPCSRRPSTRRSRPPSTRPSAEQRPQAVGTPDFDVTELNDGENLAFTVEVDVRPEFDLPDLEGFEVEVDGAEADRRGR